MKYVVFVAPYLGSTMLQALQAFAKLEGIRLGLVSHQPEEAIPRQLRPAVQGHYKVSNVLDAEELTGAIHMFQKEWGRVDRVVGYLENLQTQLAEARTVLRIEGMKRETALNFRDKNKMKQVLRQAGLPVARQARVHSASETRAFIEEVGFPIVLKPLAGVGSKNTVRVREETELLGALNLLLPSESNPIQAEEFIHGEEHTLEAVSIKGSVVWQSSTFYLPGPLKVLENPWMKYCVLLPREQTQEHVTRFQAVNEAAMGALGMRTGLSHMEWFLRQDGQPVISEVGARPPGVNIMPMLAAAHGVNIWEKWARLMVFDEWEMPKRKFAVGCAFLRGAGRGRMISRVHGLDEVQKDVAGMVLSSKLPREGQYRSSHYEGDGWIILHHPDTSRVVQGLRSLVSTIEIEYAA
jgi:biotin carboxylase